MDGWPYKTMPSGWFQVGWSGHLQIGHVEPLHLFGQELVLYRTEQGVAHLVEAHCPHLGGHLGYGGCIKGENIQCPWHGWEWDAEGRNAAIPFSEQLHRDRPSIRIRQWPLREVGGIIITWYDALDREPAWEWPGVAEFSDPVSFYQPVPHGAVRLGPFPIQAQSVVENAADPQHFHFVHGAGRPASVKVFETLGPRMYAVLNLPFGEGKEATWLTPNGPTMGELELDSWGIGLGLARFKIEDMVAPQLVAATPIDENSSYVFSSVATTRRPGDPDEPTGRALAMMQLQHDQITRDCAVWQHQRYVQRPLSLHDTERYIVPLRRWADQFYTDKFYTSNPHESEIKHVAVPDPIAG